MSRRYKGAVLSATPPTTSTSSASGIWTEQQLMQGVASGSWPALAGAPTIGTATAGALSASVAFTAPTYVGSGITGYTATSSPGGFTGTSASSPVTVSGLTAGTAYTFTVTATTAAGQGPASAASNSVTPTAPNYIEDVFSTYLYTGTGAAQTITNGIDLSTKGGLVWIKNRSSAIQPFLFDTNRGMGFAIQPPFLSTNLTDAESTTSTNYIRADTTGFSLGSSASGSAVNAAPNNYVSWTFRKQPKFFDVVTYTGNGSVRTIAHNLGSAPGCIIVKDVTSAGSNWAVYHRSLNAFRFVNLNLSTGETISSGYWNDTEPTSTEFTVGTNGNVNQSSATFVAYLFAHDAGGFGLLGTDNVISCGQFATDGAGNATVNLGYEPQWAIIKRRDAAGIWWMMDTMRGWTASTGNNFRYLQAQDSGAEGAAGTVPVNATGFTVAGNNFSASATYIYIAIRRGPMKVPTVGTSVYQGVARTGTSANATVTGAGFAPDLTVIAGRSNSSGKTWTDKLRGPNKALLSVYDNAEQTTTDWVTGFTNTGFTLGADAAGADYVNKSPKTYINWMFGRAPSFFDEVCYTGTGSNPLVLNHNLGIAPTTIIIKRRSAAASNNNWYCGVNMNASTYTEILLNSDGGGAVYSYPNWFVSAPTSTTFDLNGGGNVNQSGATYVAYLFATCPGVSKVGTYTGNGTTQTIDCGFGAGGVRFVLIKRTDSTGDWYTYDTARGMTVLTDPYLFLNTTDAEVATLGSVTTVSTGFALNSTILAAINVSGGTYIFLAIA